MNYVPNWEDERTSSIFEMLARHGVRSSHAFNVKTVR